MHIYQVDAFADRTFGGNPAAVCPLEREAPASWMQAVAAEMNLSETAFVHVEADAFRIRFFTPTTEVPLCGHATLACAHILWELGTVAPDRPITFQAPRETLRAAREGDWIRMDFPADPVRPAQPPDGLAEALGVSPLRAYAGVFPGFLLELPSAEAVRTARPHFDALRRGRYGMVILTAAGDSAPYDFVSRFFAPDFGIDEDPVTGVAHCSLTPFWAERLGRAELTGYQASRRGGVVRVRSRGARVDILGRAVTVFRGEWLARP
jgi:PhzF family phenazine biosynthesis protein